jgi:hypothetical protein
VEHFAQVMSDRPAAVTWAHVARLGDRLEVVPFAHAIRAGSFDVPAFSRGSPHDVSEAVHRALRR